MSRFNKYSLVLTLTCLLQVTACSTVSKVPGLDLLHKREPHIEVYAVQDKSLISPNAQVEVLGSGFHWAEAPVWVPSLNGLLFSDIMDDVIYKWTSTEGVSTYLSNAGSTGHYTPSSEFGVSSILLTEQDELLICQQGDRRVSRMLAPIHSPDAIFQTVSSHFHGSRYNSPNDMVQHSDGSIWFTDPTFGLPDGEYDDENAELGYSGVFRIKPDGRVVLVTNILNRPNGIAFSPEEDKVYISNSCSQRAVWMVWDLHKDGSISNGQILFDATQNVDHPLDFPGGIKVHPSGALFTAAPNGVYVLTSEGKLLSHIVTHEPTTNLAFNPDYSALFITTEDRLLRVKLK